MPRQPSVQAELAKKLGTSKQYLSAILTGRTRVGADMAKKLEKATGIPRLSWIYPSEYHNPMIKLADNGEVDS